MKIGIIGGSGLYELGIDNPGVIPCRTDNPYGDQSAELVKGTITGVEIVVLARHGKDHQFSPSQVNYRANIHALKDENVTHILATTACGSLRKHLKPGTFVIPDQFIDFTKFRKNTYHDSFESGMEHPMMADPFDDFLCDRIREAAMDMELAPESGCTVVSIEGPRFSTRAESKMFRIWGADIINMTTATEVSLANEAGIPYGAIAMVTDFDCWKEDEPLKAWQEILDVFNRNVTIVKDLLVNTVSLIGKS